MRRPRSPSSASSSTTRRSCCPTTRASAGVSYSGDEHPWPLLAALAGMVTLALVVTAGGYGYHRDELYFLEAGRHLAWGYADQGPFTPLVAHVMQAISPGSLT